MLKIRALLTYSGIYLGLWFCNSWWFGEVSDQEEPQVGNTVSSPNYRKS